jgi:hypothetical protein
MSYITFGTSTQDVTYLEVDRDLLDAVNNWKYKLKLVTNKDPIIEKLVTLLKKWNQTNLVTYLEDKIAEYEYNDSFKDTGLYNQGTEFLALSESLPKLKHRVKIEIPRYENKPEVKLKGKFKVMK